MGSVSFRPLTEGDLPLLAHWLAADHVARWWGGPQDEDAVRAKYLPRIRGDAPTQVFVVQWDGAAIGLVQRYRIADHPDWAAALRAAGADAGHAAGIDYLIGEPSLVGTGVGSAVIDAFTRLVLDAFTDVDAVFAAPQDTNRASCRVLEKNGYERIWTGRLASDAPSDDGVTALHLRRR